MYRFCPFVIGFLHNIYLCLLFAFSSKFMKINIHLSVCSDTVILYRFKDYYLLSVCSSSNSSTHVVVVAVVICDIMTHYNTV